MELAISYKHTLLHIQSLLSTLIFKNYKGLIENKRLYIALPPLYRINENGKYLYMLDDYEYDLYVYNRMRKLFDNKYTIKELKQIRKTYNLISDVSNKMNIPLSLLQTISHCNDKKEVSKVIKGEYKSLHVIKKDKIYICNGFINETYVNFIINKKLIKSLNKVNDLLKKYDAKLSLVNFEEVLKKATPKHRTRMKGLGKLIAPYRSNSIKKISLIAGKSFY